MNAIEELENNYDEAASDYLRAQMMPSSLDYSISLKTTVKLKEFKEKKDEAKAALILGWSRV